MPIFSFWMNSSSKSTRNVHINADIIDESKVCIKSLVFKLSHFFIYKHFELNVELYAPLEICFPKLYCKDHINSFSSFIMTIPHSSCLIIRNVIAWMCSREVWGDLNNLRTGGHFLVETSNLRWGVGYNIKTANW